MSRLLVVGGSGALGKSVVSAFKKINWNVTNIDVVNNQDADSNLLVDPLINIGQENSSKIIPLLKDKKFNSIICTAGGWTGGEIKDTTVFESVNKMHN